MSSKPIFIIVMICVIWIAGSGCAKTNSPSGSAQGAVQPNQQGQAPSVPFPSAKGNEGGNGGDYITFADQSAWFVDARRTIKVCSMVSKNFTQSQLELEGLVEQAFTSWRSYMDRKEVYSDLAQLRPITEVIFLPTCSDEADLKFYFGETSPEVAEARSRFFNPASMAIRTQFDDRKSWGRGFVWLADPKSVDFPAIGVGHFPDWDAQNNLLTILTHEIGHVLGNGHVEGTIMTENITRLLDWGMADKKIQIDQSRELVRSRSLTYEYQGLWSVSSKQENIEMLSRIFGEPPDDSVPSFGTSSSVLSLGLKWNGLAMPFTMTKGTRRLRTQILITSQQETTLSDKVFRTNGLWKLNESDVAYGYAVGASGERISIVLEYNINGLTPLRLVAFENGIRTEIANFEMTSP